MVLHTFRKKFTSQSTSKSSELRKCKSTGNLADTSSEKLTSIQNVNEPSLTVGGTITHGGHTVTKVDSSDIPSQTLSMSATVIGDNNKDKLVLSDSSCDTSSRSGTSSSSSSVSSVSTGSQKNMQLPMPPTITIPTITKSNSSPTTPHEESEAAERISYFSANDLDLLLSMETQARIEALEARAKAAEALTARPSRLKFELPVVPKRDRSPLPPAYAHPRQRWSLPDQSALDTSKQKKSSKSRKSRWGRIMNGSDNEKSDSERVLAVGDKVRLTRRPVLTLGYIRYIGPMESNPGQTWFGVELESRVGSNDGSVNGHRYFKTDPHRGIFVSENELALV